MQHLALLFLLLPAILPAQNLDPKNLLGRWEVLEYAEQGLQVNKKKDPLPQAIAVYRHVREERLHFFYGYDFDEQEELPKRRARELLRWAERDSAQEVHRVAEAIGTPYYVVFFADSTLSAYNRDTVAGSPVIFPEASRYVFSPALHSLHISPMNYGAAYVRWHAQVLALTETRMTLFLPEEGELVVLGKTVFRLP